MKRKKYTYIPKDEIESITTWNGKNITQDKILDGAYVRGNVKFAKGGMSPMAKLPDSPEGRMKEKIIKILNEMSDSQLQKIEYQYDVDFSGKQDVELASKISLWVTFLPNDKVEDVLRYSMSVMRDEMPMSPKFPIKRVAKVVEGRMKDKLIQILNEMSESQLDMVADKYDVEGDLGVWVTFLPNNKVEDVLMYCMSVVRGNYAKGGMMADGGMMAHGGRINSHSKVKLFNIDYDFDDYGGDDDLFDTEMSLPTKLETTLSVLGYDPLEDGTTESQIESYVSMYAADYISDRTGFTVNSFEFEIDFDSIDDDDEFANGGEIYTKSVEEQAQEMLGSRFYELNPQEREDIINSFIADGVIIPKVTYTQFEEEDFEYADGGGVATASYKVIYQMVGSKDKKEKLFTDKSKAEFFVETMEEDEDVKSVKLEELKPEGKPAKASKVKAEPTIDIFGAAKKVTTTAASKTRKPTVEIDGIGDDIARYNELKAIMDNAKAETELIGGRIKEAGLEKYIEMYEQTGRNPPNFDILSGGNSILFMVYDAYVKKISPEFREMLEQYGDGLLEVTKTYEFDTATLDKEVKGGKTVGDIIKELIGKSTEIPQEDKLKLLKVKEDVKIPKGTIDRLADYGEDNIQEIFNLIQPTLALK